MDAPAQDTPLEILKKPTGPGWWWVRLYTWRQELKWFAVEVEETAPGFLVAYAQNMATEVCGQALREFCGDWSGPIAPPPDLSNRPAVAQKHP